MNTEPSKPRSLIVIIWVFLLLASGLPRIVLQEIFNFQVSSDLGAVLAGGVVLIGLALTFLWDIVRPLRPFFVCSFFWWGWSGSCSPR